MGKLFPNKKCIKEIEVADQNKGGEKNHPSVNKEVCLLSLEDLKKIPVKNRSKEETKRYNQLKYQQRKQDQLKCSGNKVDQTFEEVVDEHANCAKVKDMTIDQRREYHRERYKARKSEQTEEEKKKTLLNWQTAKSNERKRKKKKMTLNLNMLWLVLNKVIGID